MKSTNDVAVNNEGEKASNSSDNSTSSTSSSNEKGKQKAQNDLIELDELKREAELAQRYGSCTKEDILESVSEVKGIGNE